MVEYDGTDFHGWQVQPGRRTVQGEIERALGVMTRAAIRIQGSGRTDAGVHALGQTASFSLATRLAAEALHKGLNSLLPGDIVIRECRETGADFHARFSAVGKRYRYTVLNRAVPSALDRRTAWHIRRPLDLDAMREAAGYLLGRHDFRTFEGAGSPRSDTVRIIRRADWEAGSEGFLYFHIAGDGFLRYMVRNIVGTLVETGSGKRTASSMPDLLAAGDRRRAAATAPPQGLCLMEVVYPPH